MSKPLSHLGLREVQRWVPLLRAMGMLTPDVVSFLDAYRRADGRPPMLSRYRAPSGEPWPVERNRRVRYLIESLRDSPLFEPDGQPTKDHLRLIALAYSPAPQDLNRANAETALRSFYERIDA